MMPVPSCSPVFGVEGDEGGRRPPELGMAVSGATPAEGVCRLCVSGSERTRVQENAAPSEGEPPIPMRGALKHESAARRHECAVRKHECAALKHECATGKHECATREDM